MREGEIVLHHSSHTGLRERSHANPAGLRLVKSLKYGRARGPPGVTTFFQPHRTMQVLPGHPQMTTGVRYRTESVLKSGASGPEGALPWKGAGRLPLPLIVFVSLPPACSAPAPPAPPCAPPPCSTVAAMPGDHGPPTAPCCAGRQVP